MADSKGTNAFIIVRERCFYATKKIILPVQYVFETVSELIQYSLNGYYILEMMKHDNLLCRGI